MRRAALLLLAAVALGAPRAEARGCHERSEIVGKQRCTRFGRSWDANHIPSLVFGFGPTFGRLPLTGLSFGTTYTPAHAGGPPLQVNGVALGRWTYLGPSLRVAWFPIRGLYLGAEGSMADAFVPDATVPTTPAAPALAMRATSGEVRSFGGIVGTSIPLWRFDLSLEVLGGVRAVSVDLLGKPAIAGAEGGSWTPTGATSCTPLVEPRAGLALRVQPWVTLRALGGFDPLAHGAWSASALVEIHTRPYDGFFLRRRVAPAE